MSNRYLITQPKMRRSVQVGYRRLARPVVWPVLARASAPAETPASPPAARTFPWGMMERVRQALADQPAPPAPASPRPQGRPAVGADAESQIRRQVVVEEDAARRRPTAGRVPTELGDLPPATPDAEPDSSSLLQAQPEPGEEWLSAAQAAPLGADQATPSDPSLAPPEVDEPAWDDRSESADWQSPPQPEQAAPEPVTEPRTPPAETAPRPPTAAEGSSRASDVPPATAVQRTASHDAPAVTPAAGEGQTAGQPGMASLPPAYPAGEQPSPGAAVLLPSAGGELPTQSPANQEPEVTSAAAEPQLNLWPASPQPAPPAVAPVQSGEEPPSQAMPAAEAGSVQRTPEGSPEATPGDRIEPASPPQATPGTQSGPAYQAQAQPEGAGLRQPSAPSQVEPGEGDTPVADQSEWPTAAPTLAEVIEGVRAQPAEVRREFAEVRREPVLPTEVRQGPFPPTEVGQGPISPVEARQETVPPTEVKRMPAPPADAGLIQRSAAPRAQPPVGTLFVAKRQSRGAPGAADETMAGPASEGGAWGGGSAQAANFDAPAVIQAAPAADESTASAAAPPSSGSPFTASSAPPPAADVDTLARQVYQILRRRLQVEYERNLGHGR